MFEAEKWIKQWVTTIVWMATDGQKLYDGLCKKEK